MNPLLEQLHDIEGLDPISSWPLAVGWWILISISIVILASLLWYLGSLIAFKRSWKNDTFRKLVALEKRLDRSTSKEVIIILSEYLRRIALRRFPRKECASLTGEAWLAWLSQNDPKQFDWKQKGTLLIDIPYGPQNISLPIDQVKDLINAVKQWVR